MQGVGHTFELPHDIAHFVVERGLGQSAGFWGSIAAGAVFPTMKYESGRRKPKAEERSKSVVKANAAALSEAEVLVSAFTAAAEGRRENAPAIAIALLRERGYSGRLALSDLTVKAPSVCASYQAELARWKQTPVGERLALVWRH